MATQFTEYSAIPMSRKFSWSGIFAGTFLFLAIEVTFGVLGMAIFNSVGRSTINSITVGMSPGAGIWMVVLSIIALYFAGKLASSQSASATRNAGMYAGLVTFGMCIFTALLMIFPEFGMSGSTLVIAGATARASAGVAVSTGYWLFVTLVLGMIAAASGGIHGSMTAGTRTVERTVDTKRAA
jgi:uncharacterized membrane protein YgcG